MIYQLPNGKIINISIDTYLRMSDEEIKYLSESDSGSHGSSNNPFEVSEDQTESINIVTEEYLEELPEDIEFPDNIDFDE